MEWLRWWIGSEVDRRHDVVFLTRTCGDVVRGGDVNGKGGRSGDFTE